MHSSSLTLWPFFTISYQTQKKNPNWLSFRRVIRNKHNLYRKSDLSHCFFFLLNNISFHRNKHFKYSNVILQTRRFQDFWAFNTGMQSQKELDQVRGLWNIRLHEEFCCSMNIVTTVTPIIVIIQFVEQGSLRDVCCKTKFLTAGLQKVLYNSGLKITLIPSKFFIIQILKQRRLKNIMKI